MGDDIRYKIEHIGDSFADMLENVCGSIGECNILQKVPEAAKAAADAIKKNVPDAAKSSADAIKKHVPDAAKASLDFIKKAPEALKAPMDLIKKIPVGNPVDLLKKVPDTARSSARGVILTYDIHELRKKKETLVRAVGERIVELRRETPEVRADNDDTMKTLLLEIDAIDSKLEDYVTERDERLYPVKGQDDDEVPAPAEQAEAVETETEPEAQAEAVEEQAEAVEEQTEAVEEQAEAVEEQTEAVEEQTETVEAEAEPEAQAEVIEEAPAPKSKKQSKKAKAQAKAAKKAKARAEAEETVASDEPTQVDFMEPSDTEGSGKIEVLSPELADEVEDKDDK